MPLPVLNVQVHIIEAQLYHICALSTCKNNNKNWLVDPRDPPAISIRAQQPVQCTRTISYTETYTLVYS